MAGTYFIKSESRFQEWNHTREHIAFLLIGSFVALTVFATLFPLLPFLMHR